MRGGARNYFPLPAAITDGASLAANVSFLNVAAHGSLIPRVFKVPDNTFILFMGDAGMPIIRRVTQLPDLRDYRFLQKGETVAAWHERTFRAIRDRTFFGSHLFKSDNPYAGGTSAIYEPGDIVQDLLLDFTNNSHPFMMLGVWICPVSHELHVEYEGLNGRIQGELDTLGQQLKGGALTQEEYDAVRDTMREDPEGKAFEVKLQTEPENIVNGLKLAELHSSTLYEIVHNLNNNGYVASKPIRFIVVEACRSVSDGQAIPSNNLQHILRHHRDIFEKNAAIRDRVEEHEKRGFLHRRMSLLARQLEDAGGGAGAGGGGGGGAAHPSTTYITPSFTMNMGSLARIPSTQELIAALAANRPVPISVIDTALDAFVQTSKAVINADYRALVAGLAPEKQFAPSELLVISPGKTFGFIIGPVIDSGVVKFKVVELKPTEQGIFSSDERILSHLELAKYNADQYTKGELLQLLGAQGYDLDTQIALHLSQLDDNIRSVRQANVAFGQGLPAAAGGAAAAAGVPKLEVAWAGEYGTNLGKGGQLYSAWQATDNSKKFKRLDKVTIQSSNPEMNGQTGTIDSISVVPETAPEAHRGKLRYGVILDDEKKTIKYILATMLVKQAGGRRKRRTKRRSASRRRTRKH